MPQSERSRAARIRARATGLKYQTALKLAADEPTPAQRELEGSFLHQLRVLWSAPTPRQALTSGIIGVLPRRESLTIRMGRDTDFGNLRECILPSFDVQAGTELLEYGDIRGVPGLRARTHPKGTSLYRPGVDAEIVLAGVDVREFELTSVHGVTWPGARLSNSWSNEEVHFVKNYPAGAGLDIESVMLRRIGIIRAAEPRSVDTWRAWPGTIVIELSFHDKLTREQFDQVRADLSSNYLVPQLVPGPVRAPDTGTGGSIDFNLPHTGQSVQVRLAHLPSRHVSGLYSKGTGSNRD